MTNFLQRFSAHRLAAPSFYTGILCVLLVCVPALAGCANIGTLNENYTSQCQNIPASEEARIPVLPRPDQLIAEPAHYHGPTTARTATHGIVPISDNPLQYQKLPVHVESSDGPMQEIRDTTRILALNQNGGLAAAVAGLGFGCSLIGKDTSTNFPGTEHLPLVTKNGHELDAESILALRPTLIITDTTVGPYDVQLQLRQSGIPVVMIPHSFHEGIQGVAPQIHAVAAALGVPELGERLAQRTDEEIARTVQTIGKIAPTDPAKKPRIVFLYVRGKSTYYWFGEGSGADSLIRAISAVDVAEEVGLKGMVPTNSEALIRAQPDIIIAMTKGLESAGGLEGFVTLPGVAQTPAGQNRRIVDMSDYEVMSFGPRTAEVIAALATAIYAPEAAEEIQREASKPTADSDSSNSISSGATFPSATDYGTYNAHSAQSDSTSTDGKAR
ncbi:heme/hemin ABC transporter substrate-binding protein [Schaalia sp. lx-260]|uniref:heme/hemin ABC transporter substrate-binding protein n=1 Tax=Schaalia sp. lx-260 TaxID=2899082 RepID=UPI001E59C059|nr:ABC transporter substrate-binding protein [Schaalia sp. lx-260]MCD4549019.1 ABC transporter substrate-binding protein [Schaalia sp. lx-260]